MILTEKDKSNLREMLSTDISKYLTANSIHRLDGWERADRHMYISKSICDFIFSKHTDNSREVKLKTISAWNAVHDFLADILTDRMDTVIGFPIYEPLYDVDTYKERFFGVIVSKFHEIEKVANENAISF